MDRPAAYITTPIYYVNDKPHIGHVYTTTVCDVWARYMRFTGRDVFFLTGTDEHAAKVVDAAAERGLSPQEWADQNAASFQETFQRLGMTNDDFIRTSQERHRSKVVEYVRALLESGDVYLGDYEGWYDAGQEEYVPAGKAQEYEFKSPINGRPLVRKTEKNYFFRLSEYRTALLEHFERQPKFVQPEARRNEIIQRIRDAEDVPISRTGAGDWGIKVPGDDEHTIYVWIDALFNYLTTIDTPERRRYWPATFHLIAKDILWFHACIWPAMLMALREQSGYEWVALPNRVYAHSFWISEGQKMSKSLGNFIDLAAIDHYLDVYGLDVWRYYLTTQGPLGATDSDFAAAHFHEIYNTDLVNTVGNCASRVTAMVNKYFDGVVPTEAPAGETLAIADHGWPSIASKTAAEVADAMDEFDLAGAMAAAVGLVRRVDAFINLTEPFKIAKDDSKRDELGAILYQCLEAVRIASLLLWPVCPAKSAELWDAIGVELDPDAGNLNELTRWGGIQPGTSVRKVALFPRLDQPQPAAT
jgi:methionyl-tRNA synthetase